MKQRNPLMGLAAELIRRSLFKRRDIESYGELIWLVDPAGAESQPRRPWRQELDRMSVTTFIEPVGHTY